MTIFTCGLAFLGMARKEFATHDGGYDTREQGHAR
jgi:hypothetical protein